MNVNRQLTIPTLLRAQALFSEGATAEDVYKALAGFPAPAQAAEDEGLRHLEEQFQSLDRRLGDIAALARKLEEHDAPLASEAGAVAARLEARLSDLEQASRQLASIVEKAGKDSREEAQSLAETLAKSLAQRLGQAPDPALRDELESLAQVVREVGDSHRTLHDGQDRLRQAIEAVKAHHADDGQGLLSATLNALVEDVRFVRAESERRLGELAGLEERLTRENELSTLLGQLEALTRRLEEAGPATAPAPGHNEMAERLEALGEAASRLEQTVHGDADEIAAKVQTLAEAMARVEERLQRDEDQKQDETQLVMLHDAVQALSAEVARLVGPVDTMSAQAAALESLGGHLKDRVEAIGRSGESVADDVALIGQRLAEMAQGVDRDEPEGGDLPGGGLAEGLAEMRAAFQGIMGELARMRDHQESLAAAFRDALRQRRAKPDFAALDSPAEPPPKGTLGQRLDALSSVPDAPAVAPEPPRRRPPAESRPAEPLVPLPHALKGERARRTAFLTRSLTRRWAAVQPPPADSAPAPQPESAFAIKDADASPDPMLEVAGAPSETGVAEERSAPESETAVQEDAVAAQEQPVTADGAEAGGATDTGGEAVAAEPAEGGLALVEEARPLTEPRRHYAPEMVDERVIRDIGRRIDNAEKRLETARPEPPRPQTQPVPKNMEMVRASLRDGEFDRRMRVVVEEITRIVKRGEGRHGS